MNCKYCGSGISVKSSNCNKCGAPNLNASYSKQRNSVHSKEPRKPKTRIRTKLFLLPTEINGKRYIGKHTVEERDLDGYYEGMENWYNHQVIE